MSPCPVGPVLCQVKSSLSRRLVKAEWIRANLHARVQIAAIWAIFNKSTLVYRHHLIGEREWLPPFPSVDCGLRLRRALTHWRWAVRTDVLLQYRADCPNELR